VTADAAKPTKIHVTNSMNELRKVELIALPPASFYQEIRLCTFIRLFVRGSQ